MALALNSSQLNVQPFKPYKPLAWIKKLKGLLSNKVVCKISHVVSYISTILTTTIINKKVIEEELSKYAISQDLHAT